MLASRRISSACRPSARRIPSAAADKEDVSRVDLDGALVRCLRPVPVAAPFATVPR